MFELFKQMFVNKNSVVKNVDLEDQTKVTKPGKSLTRTRFRVAYCQSPGKERAQNEDSVFVFSSELLGIDPPLSFGIYLVADGMGGHQSGEIASRLAAQAASQYLVEKMFNGTIFDETIFTEEKRCEFIKKAVDQAQCVIRQQVPGGGTTLTLAMNVDNKFYSAHVGDSRLYIINASTELVLMTKDHSLVRRLIDLGEISEEEARDHPQRNVLYCALGQIDPFEPDLDQFILNVGERMLICSDGLWGVVDDSQIQAIFNHNQNLDRAACELVKAANELGGPDNISVVLVERLI